MKWSERVILDAVRGLVRKLRLRLQADESGQWPIFRDRTVRQLQEAITEAEPILAGSPLVTALNRLAAVMCGLTAKDLRGGRILRSEIASVLQKAEQDIGISMYYLHVQAKNARHFPDTQKKEIHA